MKDQSNNDHHQGKCQYVRLDKKGVVLNSTNTLFPMSSTAKGSATRNFPFLSGVLQTLKNRGADPTPVFMPDIEFEYGGYHSVCDFTFITTRDELGERQTIWIIYDNSEHYGDLLKLGKRIRKKHAGLLNITRL